MIRLAAGWRCWDYAADSSNVSVRSNLEIELSGPWLVLALTH